MPATTPTWLIVCEAAPATPRSRLSTALATLAIIAGAQAPMPMPDRMRATSIHSEAARR